MTRFREVVFMREFERDLKKLAKRYRTLEADLETFVDTQLFALHKLKLDNKGVYEIDDLGSLTAKVYKARKFACRTLKGKGVRTGIRVIYAYLEAEDRIELVEIYVKASKESEDRARIKKYYGR